MESIDHNLFPTLVRQTKGFLSPYTCNQITAYVLNNKSNFRFKSNASIKHGGVSSHGIDNSNNVLQILSDAIKEFSVDDFMSEIQKYSESVCVPYTKIANNWVNIQDKGSILIAHTHPMAVFSGALYVNVDENSSPISFGNPNPYVRFIPTDDIFSNYTYAGVGFKPENGDLFIWPSWLEHGSNSIENLTENRMLISFNIV